MNTRRWSFFKRLEFRLQMLDVFFICRDITELRAERSARGGSAQGRGGHGRGGHTSDGLSPGSVEIRRLNDMLNQDDLNLRTEVATLRGNLTAFQNNWKEWQVMVETNMTTMHQICSLREQLQERGAQSSQPPPQPATSNQVVEDSNDINMELSPSNTPGGAAGRSAPGAAGTYEDSVRYRILEPQVPEVQVIPAERGQFHTVRRWASVYAISYSYITSQFCCQAKCLTHT